MTSASLWSALGKTAAVVAVIIVLAPVQGVGSRQKVTDCGGVTCPNSWPPNEQEDISMDNRARYGFNSIIEGPKRQVTV
jgi:hypothetical protein